MRRVMNRQRLMELFYYDPVVGVFIRRRSLSGGAKIGDIPTTRQRDGYIVFTIDGVQYLAHRLAVLYMTGRMPPDDVDHGDLNKANNAWKNLRPANRTLNNANKTVQSNNTLGVKGVTMHNGGPKFRADISIAGKKRYLGCFKTAEEASAAYASAANAAFGPYARVA